MQRYICEYINVIAMQYLHKLNNLIDYMNGRAEWVL